MTSIRPPIRELAERSSNGMLVRLLWRQGTSVLWVEVRSRDADQALAIPVPPERALDAFRHPYAYAGRTTGHHRASRASVHQHRSDQRPCENREQ